jgi:diadenosine tetraphosphate (Ap4A) HIT family hydrolase
MSYDPNNIFARILRGEVPCKKVFENQYALAFHDIHPATPVHVLIVPKGAYVDMTDFSEKAADAEIVGFIRALNYVARLADPKGQGYRVLANSGPNSHQEVPHMHMHLFAGRPLGPMIRREP